MLLGTMSRTIWYISENPERDVPSIENSKGKNHTMKTIAMASTKNVRITKREITLLPILPMADMSPTLKIPQQMARNIIGDEMEHSRFRIRLKSGSVTALMVLWTPFGRSLWRRPSPTASTIATTSLCICPVLRFFLRYTQRVFSPLL